MPAPILHVGATVLCMHAGQATPLAPSPRVMVSAQPVIALSSPYAIVGCALSSTPTPPCVTGQFVAGATRVLVGGVPAATLMGQSSCIPTGTPMLPVMSQMRVRAT